MAAAPELLKVVNLIMTAQSSIQENADEKQYRKLPDIDIDDRVRRSSQSTFKMKSNMFICFNRSKLVNAVENYLQI